MSLHPTVTQRRIVSAIRRDDGTGYCLECGKPQKYTEPDAEAYPCHACKQNSVYGAEQILLMGLV
jgi:hypothetical protein